MKWDVTANQKKYTGNCFIMSHMQVIYVALTFS